MGKVSSNDGQSKTPKQKKQSRSTKGKYLRPGALAQLHYTKVAAAKSCADLGKKRVIVITSDETKDQAALQNDVIDKSSIFLSPMKFCYDSGNTPIDVSKQNKLQRTPKTPGASECIAESRLESLPMNLLSNMISDFKKIKTWESQTNESNESYWIISNDLRREKRLPDDKFSYGIETVEEEKAEEEEEEKEEENADVSHTREYNMEDNVLPPATEEVGSNPQKEGDIKDKKKKKKKLSSFPLQHLYQVN
ncbi:hypothetical protein T459_09494 [Capsicum annuum]|uniref:Uncharacterized protein n=1 Tax=Capsicum annuum TaxID=4072 RepID=A0A2G2ZZK6_CAPAN|nr:hypothetical protein T459_09494 [Capsicum annuum]